MLDIEQIIIYLCDKMLGMKRFIFSMVIVLCSIQGFSQTNPVVVAPNGGENWIIGCPYLIQWIASNTSGTVKIELYRNDVFNMTICSQVPPGMNSYSWIPPINIIPGNTFKVKITSLTSAASFDFSDGYFSINNGNITVNSPNGGEVWVKGTTHPILWTDNICDNVRIELWKGGVFNSLIAASVPSNGSFNWVVPNTATMIPGNDYKIKVMSVSGAAGTTSLVYDFSDNPFTISAGQNTAFITLVTPNGGENWIMGCPYVIQWITAAVSPGPVLLELFKNDVFCMNICSQVPAGQNVFTWIPAFSLIPGNTYKVKATLLTSPGGFDFSNTSFSINTGSITVNSPNGGEVWVKGTMHPILWADNICDNVRIELWKGGVYNSLIAASVPSNGSFNWVVPNTTTMIPGNDYKVKVMSLPGAAGTSSLVSDFSDNLFTIAAGQNTAAITLVTPNGGENWIEGCPYVIQWITAAVPSGPVRLELFKNDVFCMNICQQVPAGQNVFTWIPAFSLIPGNTYKVKATLLTSSGGFDFSNSNFSINGGSITVNSPNGGEVWVKGTMHQVLWAANICENARIELWKGGVYNSVIAASIPSTGSFNWVVPNTATMLPGNDYKVKVMNVPVAAGTTSMIFDFSNNFFTIAGTLGSLASMKMVRVYPNPFSDELHVDFLAASEVPLTLEIFGINGGLLFSRSFPTVEKGEVIDLSASNLPYERCLLLVKQGEFVVQREIIIRSR